MKTCGAVGRLAQGLSLFPPSWSDEARQALPVTSRRAVSTAELLGTNRDLGLQFDGAGPGFLEVV
ncbi:hypothetical protein [Streptomyces sp. NPDC057686]|uniref:hypothetical protein n=1 Tax=Streptomyces sp. NPDC057686 TaxID=3346212 RepID=UPI0036853A8B